MTGAQESAVGPDDLLASYRRRASEEIERRLPRGEQGHLGCRPYT